MIELPLVTRDAIGMNLVADELRMARKMHAPMNSSHEAYAVILEELDEFWEEVKKKKKDRNDGSMRRELTQVAAMAIRAMSDLNLVEVQS